MPPRSGWATVLCDKSLAEILCHSSSLPPVSLTQLALQAFLDLIVIGLKYAATTTDDEVVLSALHVV